MSDALLEVVAKGKSLPIPDRISAIRELAASLDSDQSFWLSDEWNSILDQRAAELDKDPSRAVSWAEVDRRLEARIRRHVDG
jgi:putative addiction module component (TIGR02574 family)